MRRFGDITFRYINGMDLIPTLPPDLPGLETQYKQLPADRTLYRTIGGQCLKANATNGLLDECPAGYTRSDKAKAEKAKAEKAKAEKAKAGNKKPPPKAKGRGGGKEERERCAWAVGDHRLYKALDALGACVVRDAAKSGGGCAAVAVRAILPQLIDA